MARPAGSGGAGEGATNGSAGTCRGSELMHHWRAYLASLGTGGSLVAGAALLFVFASALVSWSGWPHVGSSSPTVSVVLPARVGARTAPPSPRVLALVATAGAGAVAPTVLGAPVLAGAGGGGARRPVAGVGPGAPGTGPAAVPRTVVAGAGPAVGAPSPVQPPQPTQGGIV